MEWWAWLLIGIGIAAVLGVSIWLAVKYCPKPNKDTEEEKLEEEEEEEEENLLARKVKNENLIDHLQVLIRQ